MMMDVETQEEKDDFRTATAGEYSTSQFIDTWGVFYFSVYRHLIHKDEKKLRWVLLQKSYKSVSNNSPFPIWYYGYQEYCLGVNSSMSR
jgi:hypothetical protein